jgi:NADH-quinone oxidoreductase subunit J
MDQLFFWLFAALVIGGGIGTLWFRYVVHSAFALMATFLGVAGMFVLLGADFLAVTQVLIYVGGILVLILFGIMLTPPDRRERSNKRVLGLTISILGIVLFLAFRIASVARWMQKPEPPAIGPTAARIGKEFLRADGYLIPFELASVVLLVALIGSVFIARRRKMTRVGMEEE